MASAGCNYLLLALIALLGRPSVTVPNFVAVGQTVWGSVGVPKFFGDPGAPPLGTWAWLTPRNILLPHLCYHSKFGQSRSNHTKKIVITEICQKILTAFQGHSRSLNRLRSIGCLCSILTIALSRSVSEINGLICTIFPPFCIYRPSWEVSLGIL